MVYSKTNKQTENLKIDAKYDIDSSIFNITFDGLILYSLHHVLF